MRTQLHGLRPSLPLFVSLASGIFCLVAGTVLLSDTQHVALFAAAVTAVPLIALSRSDYPLSRCAPSIGFSARWVLIAHGLIPLGVAVVASAAVFLLRGFDAVALSMMWGAWGLFSTIAALRSLRYPRFSKHSADLRLVGDVVVLAMLGITFLPLVLPGAVAFIYQAARAHRRLIWIVS